MVWNISVSGTTGFVAGPGYRRRGAKGQQLVTAVAPQRRAQLRIAYLDSLACLGLSIINVLQQASQNYHGREMVPPRSGHPGMCPEQPHLAKATSSKTSVGLAHKGDFCNHYRDGT
jgi:hypothetical protein